MEAMSDRERRERLERLEATLIGRFNELPDDASKTQATGLLDAIADVQCELLSME